MQIKSIVAGAAFALALSVGSASAAEQFATLEGLAADPLTSEELAGVVGAFHTGGGAAVITAVEGTFNEPPASLFTIDCDGNLDTFIALAVDASGL